MHAATNDKLMRHYALAKGVKVAEFPLSAIDSLQLQCLTKKMTSSLEQQGSSLLSDLPLIGFHAYRSEKISARKHSNFVFVPCVWPNHFGMGLSLTAYERTNSGRHLKVIGRSVLFEQDEVFPKLLVGNFITIFFSSAKPTAAFKIDFCQTRKGKELWSEFLSDTEGDAELLFKNKLCHFWRTLPYLGDEKDLTKKEHLGIGSTSIFAASLIFYSKYFKLAAFGLTTKIGDETPIITTILTELIESKSKDRRRLYAIVQKLNEIVQAPLRLAALIKEFEELLEDEEVGSDLAVVSDLFDIVLLSPAVTDNGTRNVFRSRLASLRTTSIDLPLKRFAKKDTASYWEYLPWARPWTSLLEETALHINLEPDAHAWSVFAFQGDLKEVDGVIDALLLEGAATKEISGHLRLRITFSFGLFDSVEVIEQNDTIWFFLVDENQRYAVIEYNLELRQWRNHSFAILFNEKVLWSLKLALAALVRDAWVLECSEGSPQRLTGQPYDVGRGPFKENCREVMFDLPRRMPERLYEPNLPNLDRELALKERSPHFVVGHKRKVGTASEAQVLLAAAFNITLPPGFTFIRPHYRGKGADLSRYRKLSALEALYS